MRIGIKILNFVLATILLTSAALHQERLMSLSLIWFWAYRLKKSDLVIILSVLR